MNQAIKDLIAAIATVAKERQVYLSKTKLLKLLYLFDVEFYRQHRQTFTNFNWKFFHLGPWTNEFDGLLESLVREGTLLQRASSRPDFDSTTYLPGEDKEISSVLTNIHDEFALNRVLKAWIERPVGEILDHVYFHTEPMENAVRNTPLDFSVIPQEQPERYRRLPSNTDARAVMRIRQAFRESLNKERARQPVSTQYTPPRYDEEFFQAMAKLEEDSA